MIKMFTLFFFFIAALLASNEFIHSIQTPFGLMKGLHDPAYPNVVSYLGMRFAEPVKRFEPSRVLEKNAFRIWELFELPPVCPQYQFYLNQNEDCLFVNIYAPKKISKNLPVLVYFFGGAYILGSGAEHKVYDGSYLAQTQNAIILQFNYRVNIFGFLNHPEILETNFGMTDQMTLLHFLKDLLPSFNTNIRNVILWGESAGAASILHLLSSPQFDFPIQKVILQSPPLGLNAIPRRLADQRGIQIAKKLGCYMVFNVLKCLQEVPIEQLKRFILYFDGGLYSKTLSQWLFWMPVVDGTFLTHSNILQSPTFKEKLSNIKILIGNNRDELELLPWIRERMMFNLLPFKLNFPQLAALPSQWLRSSFQRGHLSFWMSIFFGFSFTGLHYRTITQLYGHSASIIDILSDYVFHCPSLLLAKSVPSAYLYRFDFQPNYLKYLGGTCAESKVCHAVEIPYLFHTVPTFITFQPRELEISKLMTQDWFGFVRNHKLKDWSAYKSSEQVKFYNDHVTIGTFENDRLEKCHFWDTVGYIF